MTPTKAQAYFCPSCGSASLFVHSIAGGDAHCQTCPWTGPQSDLIVHHFEHDLGSNEAVMHMFLSEYKNVLAKNFATPLTVLLHKWGFFKGRPTPAELT